MALFSGFNQLSSKINNFSSQVQNISSQATGLVNQASARFDQFNSSVSSISNGVSSLSNLQNIASNPLGALRTAGSVAQEFQNLGSVFSQGFGSRTRMASNAQQGVFQGAESGVTGRAQATFVDTNAAAGGVDSGTNDWRVSLSVPSVIADSPLFAPFRNTNNKLIFPITPTILFGNSANYSNIHPIHINYPYHAYQNSQVNEITIAGEFVVENESDGQYWIAVLHYLRTVTKMFYGQGADVGNPPLIVRLNGYGNHVLNNIPCVVSQFTTDLPNDVDYLAITTSDGTVNYVPTSCQVNVTLLPQYSRRQQSNFDLRKFANGDFVGKPEGFI